MTSTNARDDLLVLYNKVIKRLAKFYFNHDAIANDNSLCVDDIEQEISIAWLKAYHSYNPDKAAFNTHFHNVAANHMKDFIRSVMSNKATPVFVPLSEAASLEAPDVLGDMERREAISHVLRHSLPKRDAQLVMAYFGIGSEDGVGLTQEELAERYGITRTAVAHIISSVIHNPKIVDKLQELFL